jgi:formate hydrogenlyase subunit 6/NADH:ubiquinone oxidoreductase subunit I
MPILYKVMSYEINLNINKKYYRVYLVLESNNVTTIKCIICLFCTDIVPTNYII